jgi:hypothetical protein
VDRQGNGRSWSYIAQASGGYFTFVSPALAEPVDNQNYAYYFSVILSSSASSNLQAMQVQVDYLSDMYLPAITRGH